MLILYPATMNSKTMEIMKKLLIASSLILAIMNLPAQDCQDKKFFKKGTKLSFENKKDGKTVGTDKQEVVNVVTTAQGMEATISSESASTDKTGPVTYKILCNGNSISIDLKGLISQEIMKKMNASGLEAKIISSENIEFPLSAKPGTELKDAKATIQIGIQGNPIGTVNIVIRNRKIEGEEKVTTPAGIFNCVKVTGDFEMESNIMSQSKKQSKNTSWINESIGPVKTENTDAAGKVENSRILTKLE